MRMKRIKKHGTCIRRPRIKPIERHQKYYQNGRREYARKRSILKNGGCGKERSRPFCFAKMYVGKKHTQQEITHTVVKHKYAVDCVRRAKTGKERALGSRKSISAKNGAACGNPKSKICKKSEYARRHQPVQISVMRAVKPLFPAIQARVIVFTEWETETLLPPAKKRPFRESFQGNVPYCKPRGGIIICERD